MAEINFSIKPENHVSNININSTPATPAAKIPVTQEQPPQPSIYGKISNVPLLNAVEGIKFDFNEGIRILFPHNGKNYRCVFSDIDTGVILYAADTVPGAYITSVKKFYIKFRLQIFTKDGKEPIFTHDYGCTINAYPGF